VRAGEVDMLRINQEIGTTANFFKEWGLPMPQQSLDKLAELEKQDAIITPKGVATKKVEAVNNTKFITLIYTQQEADELIKIAESLYSKFKVDNVTDLVLKGLKHLKKMK
jgi:hypothetical protein